MLTKLEISSAELARLNYDRYHYPCPLVQKRLHSIYIKVISGLSNEDVGNFTDAHRNSISAWVKVYQQGGIDALLKVNPGTNKSLPESQAVNIGELFTKQPPRSIGEAIIKIKALTGIERSHTRVREFMKRHKFRFLKTGHIPAKVNNRAQHNWVEQTLKPVIKAAQDREVHLLFMDAAHFVLEPFLCCLWCVARIFIKASPGCNPINVMGAVNGIPKQISTYSNTTYICANCLIAFLKQLKKQYNDKPIAVVLDNARYQHCFVVKTFANSLGIHLLFFPPTPLTLIL